jgi:hypothetical protein
MIDNSQHAEKLLAARLTLVLCGYPGFKNRHGHDGYKKPIWSFKDSPHTAAGIRKAFETRKDWIVAIDAYRSGLELIDADRNHAEGVDGVASLERLLDQHGELPEGLAIYQTPRGGIHVVGKAPTDDDRKLRSTSGTLGAGIDTRGLPVGLIFTGERPDGTYQHIAGPEITDPISAELPAWVFELTQARPIEQTRVPGGDAIEDDPRLRPWALAALDGERSKLSRLDPGSRNHRLFKSVARLAGIAARGWLNQSEVWNAMQSAFAANGYLQSRDPSDGRVSFRSTFNSAWRKGFANPSAGPQERLPTADGLVLNLKIKGKAA